jgi:hypothetical protein
MNDVLLAGFVEGIDITCIDVIYHEAWMAKG